MERIQRICSVRLDNFKGFAGTRGPLDTDADIVLITGPNGYGKTSLLEAITALLTGYHPYDKEAVRALVPVVTKDPNMRCRIEVETDLYPAAGGEKKNWKFSIAWDQDGVVSEPQGEEKETVTIDKIFPRPKDIPTFPSHPFFKEKPDRYELHARLCAFFQERVAFQYDQGVSGATLRDVINPVPAEIEKIQKRLGEFIEGLKSRVNAWCLFSSKATDEEISQKLAQHSRSFMTHYNQMAKWRQGKWPAGPPSFERGEALNEFVRTILGKSGLGVSYSEDLTIAHELSSQLEATLKRSLAEWITDAEKRAAGTTEEGRHLQGRLEWCEGRMQEIEKDSPKLAQEVALFEPLEPQECDALILLRTLADNAERWAALELPDQAEQEQGRLKEVLTEFGRVDVTKTIKCRNILDTWFGRRQALWREYCALKAEVKNLEEELVRYRSSEEVTDAKEITKGLTSCFEDLSKAWKEAYLQERERADFDQRQARADALERHQVAAQNLLTAVEKKIDLSKEQFEALAKIVRGVAKRFSLVEGMLPRELVVVPEDPKAAPTSGNTTKEKRIMQCVKTDDGREMVHFSTGQKAQIGISLLVAQNLYLSDFLPHRVILLDDLTTAYDLSNLSREAVLWRQLAYGRKQGDPLARQVFISTHHEELTSKLLELLVPPDGRSLRVVQFCGYSKEKGPQYELYKVESTAPSASARQALAAELQTFHP